VHQVGSLHAYIEMHGQHYINYVLGIFNKPHLFSLQHSFTLIQIVYLYKHTCQGYHFELR
jgi:hypothetical protein